MKIKYTGPDLVRVNGKLIKPNEIVEFDEKTARDLSGSPSFELVNEKKFKIKSANKKAGKRKGGE